MSTATSSSSAATTPPPVSRATLLLLATVAGVSAANIYYNQPLVNDLRQTFPDSARWVGAVPAATQLGYAAGLFFLAPLGDRFERCTIILCKSVGLCIALAVATLAPNLLALVMASLCVGILATIAQQAVPFAAELAPPAQRGQAVGMVMSGLLLGILLARTASGAIAEHFGWRTVFGTAVVATVILAVVVALRLPRSTPTSNLPYTKLLGSMWHLLRDQPVLREAALTGSATFAGFGAFWATLTFLLAGAPFHLGSEAAGLFGVVGAGGALIAPLAGKSADKRGPRTVVSLGLGLYALGFVIFALFSTSLLGLIAGVVVLDIAVQAVQISNQSRIYALIPEARSRINTVYMVIYFLGGAVGSACGAIAWRHFGWYGVSGFGLLTALVAAYSHRPRRAA